MNTFSSIMHSFHAYGASFSYSASDDRLLFWHAGIGLSLRCFCVAVAVFDGHSGSQSAQYLSKELYKVFSEAIDDEAEEAEECAIEGAWGSDL